MANDNQHFIWTSPSQGHPTALGRNWLIERLGEKNEATIITAYWDGTFFMELLNDKRGLGDLKNLTVYCHSSDYEAKKTLLRDTAITARTLTDKYELRDIAFSVRLVPWERAGIFHAKAYIFGCIDSPDAVWVGSINATRMGFDKNGEVLARVHPEAYPQIRRWLDALDWTEPRKAVPPRTLSSFLMGGELWTEPPKATRSFNLSLKEKEHGWKPTSSDSSKALDIPGTEIDRTSRSISLYRVAERCGHSELAKYIKKLSDQKRLRFNDYAVWTVLGWWSPPVLSKTIRKNTDERTTELTKQWKRIHELTWTCVEDPKYQQALDKTIEALQESSPSLDTQKVKNSWEKQINRMCRLAGSQRGQARLSRPICSSRVPNLDLMTQSEDDLAEHMIQSWIESLLDKDGETTKANGATKILAAVLSDLNDREEFRKLADAWQGARLAEGDALRKDACDLLSTAIKKLWPEALFERVDHLLELSREMGWRGEWDLKSCEHDDWKTDVKKLLRKVHTVDGDRWKAHDYPDEWHDALSLFSELGIPRKGWMALRWDDEMSPEQREKWDDQRKKWDGLEWNGWVWWNGIPIYDPPDAFFGECNSGESSPRNGSYEDGLPSFEKDEVIKVVYTSLEAPDLREAIRSCWDKYRCKDGFPRDMEGLKTDDNSLPHYLTYKDYTNLSDKDLAFWRRRLTAIDGALSVAPLGAPYYNLWGEPCCCGRVFERADPEEFAFKPCRLCGYSV